MLYKNFFLTAGGLLAGIALYTFTSVPIIYALLAFCISLPICMFILYCELKWKEFSLIFSILGFVVFGMASGYMRMHIAMQPVNIDLDAYISNPEGTIRIYGTVTGEPILRNNVETELLLSVKKVYDFTSNKWVDTDNIKVLVKILKNDTTKASFFETLSDNEIAGTYLDINAQKISPAAPLSLSEFDYINYMQKNNIGVLLSCGSRDVGFAKRADFFSLKDIALKLKEYFIQTYRRTVPSPESRIVTSVILGTRRSLDMIEYEEEKITDIFKKSGVTVFIENSGLHVVILSLMLYTLFWGIGFKTRHLAPAIIGLILLFTLLSGARPAAVQALTVTAIAIAVFSYLHYNIRKSAIIGLSMTVIVICLYNPFSLFTFQFMLTFGSILVLIGLTPPVLRWLNMLHGFTLIIFFIYYLLLVYLINIGAQYFFRPEYLIVIAGLAWGIVRIGRLLNNRFPLFWNLSFISFPVPIKAIVAFLLSYQAGVLIPLSVWDTGLFPTSSLVLLWAAVPVIGMILFLGTITGLTGLIPFFGEWIALPLGGASWLLSRFLLIITHAGSDFLKSPTLPKPDFSWIIYYFIILLLCLYLFKLLPYFKAVFYKIDNHLNSFLLRALPFLAALVILLTPLVISITAVEREMQMIVYHTQESPVVSLITYTGDSALIISPAESINTDSVSSGVRSMQSTSISTLFTSQVNSQIISDIATLKKQGFKPSTLLLPKSLANETNSFAGLPKEIEKAFVSFYNLTPSSRIIFGSEGFEEEYMILSIFGQRVLLLNSLKGFDINLIDDGSGFSLIVIPEINSEQEHDFAIDIINGTKTDQVALINGMSKFSKMFMQNLSVREIDLYRTGSNGALFFNISQNHFTVDTLSEKRKREQIVIPALFD